METEIHTANVGGESQASVTLAPQISLLSQKYASRGIVKAVQSSAQEQIAREEKTRELAPDAYRLSTLSDPAADLIYRRGKEAMNSSDLLRYFDETHQMRVRGQDFSSLAEEDDEACEEEKALSPINGEVVPSVASSDQHPAAIARRFLTRARTWVDAGEVDRSQNKRTFPLSAFAALFAVAMSLMLIVASSIMTNEAEERVIALNRKVDQMVVEVADLQSDWDVQNNLIQIRRIATEEYGMVGEEYIKVHYISVSDEDRVESFKEESSGGIRLSALLSAIGIDIKD